MKTKKELIVFDLDGTLIDTLRDLNNAVNFALTKNGFENRDLEHTRRSIGDGVAMLVKRSVPSNCDEETYKKTLKDFEDYYRLHSAEHTTPYTGMKETLEYLKRKGYLLAVSTNKIENVAQELIDSIYPCVFDTVCGDNKVRQRKPAPDSINEIMRRLAIHDKSKIIYIGDTEVDHLTAENSGVDSLIVTYGYRTEEELQKFHFDNVCIHSPSDIKKHFK